MQQFWFCLTLFLAISLLHPISSHADIHLKKNSFHVSVQINQVEINWTTEKETGQAAFFIERSQDGGLWDRRYIISNAGNSQTEKSYTYSERLHGQYSYYRLVVEDEKGSQVLSIEHIDVDCASVYVETEIDKQFKILTIGYIVNKDKELLLRIYDKIGQQVHTQLLSSSVAGKFYTFIDASKLKKGNYLLAITQIDKDIVVGETRFEL